jgi:hypothetical protein
MWHNVETKWAAAAARAAPTGLRLWVCSTVLEKGSTRRRLAARKSTPRIGLETAANKKVQK